MTITRIKQRRGTAAAWTAANPTLDSGEFGVETDTGKIKLGDGSTAWTALNYLLEDAALTGTPTAPTAAPGTDTTQVANTAFVKGAVDNATSGTGVVLTWDISDYSPASMKASSKPKEFRGPVDPSTVDGVILNDFDVWLEIAGYSPLTAITWHSAYWADDYQWSDPGDGGAVSSWRDGSGNGLDLLQATGTNQPAFRQSSPSMNGRAVVEFRADDTMGVTFPKIAAQPYSIVMVARLNALASSQLAGGDDGTNRGSILVTEQSAGVFRWQINAGATQNGSATPDTTKHLLTAVFNGASSKLEVDGTVDISAGAGTATPDGWRVALNIAGTAYLDVDVAFLAMFEGDVTADPAWPDFEAWVANTYGLTIA